MNDLNKSLLVRQIGAKGVIILPIIAVLHEYERQDGIARMFTDCFAGSGIVGCSVAAAFPHWDVELSELNVGRYCLLVAVRDAHEELKEYVRSVLPTADDFYRIKEEHKLLASPSDSQQSAKIGFENLVLSRLSRNGLAEMGGLKYNPQQIDPRTGQPAYRDRWHPKELVKIIDRWHEALNPPNRARIEIHNVDYRELARNETVTRFLYADPTYYVVGKGLYKHALEDDGHIGLSILLQQTPHDWLLSYDDNPQLWLLYEWASMLAYEYPSGGPKMGKRQRELLICPDRLNYLLPVFLRSKGADRDLASMYMRPPTIIL